ncbi:MAG: hypothetical protein R3Y29_06290 [bacterium]
MSKFSNYYNGKSSSKPVSKNNNNGYQAPKVATSSSSNQALNSAQQCCNCGRIFLEGDDKDHYCKACQRHMIMDDNIQNIKKFIQSNPGADISSVSRATGVSVSVIMRHIRDGRISTM